MAGDSDRPAAEGTLRIRPWSGAAGGWGAIRQVVRHAASQTGLLRGGRLLLRVNQAGGFDCPGCAWPDPADRSAFEFCENGAKAVAEEATRARVDPAFFARHPVSELLGWSDHALGRAGRLTHPMIRRPGADRYEPLPWDEAFALLARELRALDHPDQAVFYTSGRASNEAAFLYQLFVRQLGTNNLPDCSNMCHESSGVGLTEVLGVGKGTVTLEDFDRADLVLLLGQNPATNHPRMLTTLQQVARRGGRIVAVNPLVEPGLVRFRHPQEVRGLLGPGTPLASHWLQVRINGDVALLRGLQKAVLALERARPGEVLDHAFLAEHTHGFEAFRDAVEATPWEAIEAGAGLPRARLEEVARLYAEADATIACWAMGLTQHVNAVANVQEVVNLLLLRGNVGRPGAGACPVRGHSNVQGDRTMGIWERPPDAFLDRLRDVFGFEPPRRHGVSTVEAIEGMHAGRQRVFLALGGNFLSAAPDTAFTAEALSRCRLTAHVSTKLNRSHLVTGAIGLILPCLGRTERDVQASGEQLVTVENSMGVVHPSRGHEPPASPHLLSEPALVARLAEATLGDRSRVPWRELAADYDRIRDLIAETIPGFEDLNARVRAPGGLLLPNPARDRAWHTASGRATFTVHALPDDGLAPDELLMMTIRSHDQFNTTIYGLDDRYRGVYGGRRVVLLGRDDMAARGLAEGAEVRISSHHRGRVRAVDGFRVVPADLPPRCCATYFPEANALVPVDKVAERSYTPASKSIAVRIAATSASDA